MVYLLAIHPDGQVAEGKGIWVLRSGRFRIRNIEFRGARSPVGNASGIRFERGTLDLAGSGAATRITSSSGTRRGAGALTVGTGTSVAASAFMIRYSRSTWCALLSNTPGGFLRIT